MKNAENVEAIPSNRDGTNGAFLLGPGGDGEWGRIQFQDGPVHEAGGRNGAFIEEILEGVILFRLRELNAKFPCRENSLAITNIEQGLMWLNRRTELRRRQGVEGRNVAHASEE